MTLIDFSKQEKAEIIQKIQDYFIKELDQEIGQFEAEFLLNFFTDEIGPYYYNKAVQDSQAILQKKIDEIIETIDSLEKPITMKRKSEK